MDVAILIRKDEELEQWAAWARWLVGPLRRLILVRVNPKADAPVFPVELGEGDELSALIGRVRSCAREAWDQAQPESEEEPPPYPEEGIRLAEVPAGMTAAELEAALGLSRSDVWLVPWLEKLNRTPELERDLLEQGQSAFIALRPGSQSPADLSRILVPVLSASPGRRLLRFAQDSAAATGHAALAIQAQRPIGPDAEELGRQRLKHQIQSAFDRGTPGALEQRVELVEKPRDAVAALLDLDHDAVLWGVMSPRELQRFLFGQVSKTLNRDGNLPALLGYRPAARWSGRLFRILDRWLGGKLPQLEREQRLLLFERLETSSRSDIDFISLIVLSTGIAAFGLVLDSPAVIIGAMLVAPLMTPLVGTGFAVAQGNLALARNAAFTVVVGFSLALGVGLVTGLVTNDGGMTNEMLSRSVPGHIDLLVAVASGLAAAYATARPGLSSALPGVAIAAALVPPLATVGLGLADYNYAVAGGAALLFAANMVAIIFGSAAVLWSMGVRPDHAHGSKARWGRRVFIAVGALTLMLALGLGELASSRDDAPLRTRVQAAVHELLNDRPRVSLDRVRVDRRDPATLIVHLDLASESAPTAALLDALAAEVHKSLSTPCRVEFSTRLTASRVRR